MIGTPAIRNLIRENKIAQMYSSIQTGQNIGMQTPTSARRPGPGNVAGCGKRREGAEQLRCPSGIHLPVPAGARRPWNATRPPFMHDLLRLMLQKNGCSTPFITAGFPPAIKVDGRIVPQSNQILQPQHTTELARRDHERPPAADSPRPTRSALRHPPAASVAPRQCLRAAGLPLGCCAPSRRRSPLLELGPPPRFHRDRARQARAGDRGRRHRHWQDHPLASLVDYRNENTYGHIITIEDPIESGNQHKNCIVSQREIGIDTESWMSA